MKDIELFVDDYKFSYRVAGILLSETKDQILLQRSKDNDYWYLPGGKCQLTEKSSETIQREFWEELNIEVEVIQLIWIVENMYVELAMHVHEIALYYQVSNRTPGLATQLGENSLYRWFNIKSLADVTLYPEFLKTTLWNLPLTPQHLTLRL